MSTSNSEGLPKGLCPWKRRHDGHPYKSLTLGSYFCTGDPDDREPGRSQRAVEALQEEEEA